MCRNFRTTVLAQKFRVWDTELNPYKRLNSGTWTLQNPKLAGALFRYIGYSNWGAFEP